MRTALLVLVVLILASGCLGTGHEQNARVKAYSMNESSTRVDAVVFNNSTIQQMRPLQRAVMNASRTGTDGWAVVPEQDYPRLAERWNQLSQDGDDDPYVYITYRGELYQVIMYTDD